MAAMSSVLESLIHNAVFRTSTSSIKPTHLYLALCTATPTASSTGSTITEVSSSGTAYARQQLDPLDANWAYSSGAISNSVAFTFPVATGSFGTVSAWSLCDASTGGNVMYWGAFSSSQSIATGNQFTVPIGQLTITLS